MKRFGIAAIIAALFGLLVSSMAFAAVYTQNSRSYGEDPNGNDVQISVDVNGVIDLPALPAGSAIIGKVGIDQTTPGTTNGVQVNAELPAGTQIVGQVGIDQTTDGTTNKVRAFQPTHDNFNANVNLQVGDTDVGAANTVPVKIDQTTPGTTNGVYVNTIAVGDNNIGNVDVNSNLVDGTQVCTDDPNQAIYAAEAAANTQVTLDLTSPASPVSKYEITIYNPSTVTALTVKAFCTEATLGGDTRYGYLTSWPVLASQAITGTTINTYSVVLSYPFVGTNLRLVISNDTVLGVGEGFTAEVRVRAVL